MDTQTAREPRFSSLISLFGQALGFDAHAGAQKKHAGVGSENDSTYVRGSTVMVELPGGRWKQLPLEVKVLSRSPARGTLGGRKMDRLVFNVKDVSPVGEGDNGTGVMKRRVSQLISRNAEREDIEPGVIKWRLNQLVPRNQFRFQLVVEGDRESSLEFSLQDI